MTQISSFIKDFINIYLTLNIYEGLSIRILNLRLSTRKILFLSMDQRSILNIKAYKQNNKAHVGKGI